ncbi:hypothetical protein ACFL5O_00460 [Myxococcota bacterium]
MADPGSLRVIQAELVRTRSTEAVARLVGHRHFAAAGRDGLELDR